jgi:hypothetical protein
MTAMSSTQPEQRADLGAALALRSELPLRPLEKDAFVTRTVLDLGMVGFDLLAVIAGQFWFWIERVDVRNAPGHKQEDDVLRLCRKVWLSSGQRIPAVGQQLLHDPRKHQRAGGCRSNELAACCVIRHWSVVIGHWF